MQKFWLIFVSSLAISLHPLSLRAADFEGALHMATTHVATNNASTMDWYLKGDKARVEMSRCGSNQRDDFQCSNPDHANGDGRQKNLYRDEHGWRAWGASH
jgi:hypothetical protein